MDHIKDYLEIVEREKEIKAQNDQRLNEAIRDQQIKYVDLINPIMSKSYTLLWETHKSLKGGVTAKNLRCEIKAPPTTYGISGKKIKHNEIILSIDVARRSMPVIGELKITHDDIFNPKIKIITTKNNMATEQKIEIDKIDDNTMEGYIIEFLKTIFS
jgi:hypothetical protein